MSEVPSMITEKERITKSALPDPKTELNGHSGSAERGKLKKTARIISCICHPLIIGSTVIILQATLAIHHPCPAVFSLIGTFWGINFLLDRYFYRMRSANPY